MRRLFAVLGIGLPGLSPSAEAGMVPTASIRKHVPHVAALPRLQPKG